MNRSRGGAPEGDRARRLDAVAKSSLEIGRERAMVEEVVGRLREDERRLQLDIATLQEDREQRETELAKARDRVASLDASSNIRQLRVSAKEQELMAARSERERTRERVRQLEQEVLGYRKQIAATQRRLAALVEGAVHIQNKLWRGSRLV